MRKIKRLSTPAIIAVHTPEYVEEFWEGQTLGSMFRDFRDSGVPPTAQLPRTFDEDGSTEVDPHADIRTDFSVFGEVASTRAANEAYKAKMAALNPKATPTVEGSQPETSEA